MSHGKNDRNILIFGPIVNDDVFNIANNLGLSITYICDAIGWEREYVDDFIEADVYNKEEVISGVTQFHKSRGIDGIVNFNEMAVHTAAAAANCLSLVSNTYASAYNARNKSLMRKKFLEHDVPSPRFKSVSSIDEAKRTVKEIGFPIVIKPSLGQGSQGVIRVNNLTELQQNFSRVKNIIDRFYSHHYQMDNQEMQILIEEYIEGPEVSCESILNKGCIHILAIYDKPHPMSGPFFEETLYVTPSRHPQKLQNAIIDVTQKGLEALGIITGPTHTELRLSLDGPKIIEIAARAAAGYNCLKYATGIDFAEIIFRNALGETIDTKPTIKNAAGYFAVPAPKYGKITRISGFSDVLNLPGIMEVMKAKEIGDEILPFPESGPASALGWFIAQAGSTEEVERILYEAYQKISVNIQ